MKNLNDEMRSPSCSRKIFFALWCIVCVSVANASAVKQANRLHWIKNDEQQALVFDGPQLMFEDMPHLTRDGIWIGTDDPIKLSGYAIFDSNANVMCGSLAVNGQWRWYDTPAYQDNFPVIPTYQNNQGYGNTIFLANGFVFFFMGKQYTAAQVASGAVLPILQPYNVVYHKGINTVSGFMGLGGGITILPDASASLSTLITLTGPIDLRETGTLILSGNLNLASHLTVSSGGGIYGNGKTLYLTGNTWLPSSKIFHIMNDTVINGNGYTLTIGDYGQLFVDNAVTLTLQNITLKSGAKTSVFPPIRCAGSQSNLVLDDTNLAPGADIPFYQGQMFVYDSVHITGTSAFVYQSPQSTFIMPNSSLTFDPSTTFSFMPATNSKDQIAMSNATSQLVLNGCKLKITDTGMQLTKGTLTYQGIVGLDTKNGYSLSSLITATNACFLRNYAGGGYESIRWHPKGCYFVCTGDHLAGYAKVFRLNFANNTTTQVCNASYGGSSDYPYTVDWSPDGRYLTMSGSSGVLKVFSFFTEASLTQIISQAISYWCRSLRWSLDGKYIAAGCDGALKIYSFNGTSAVVKASATSTFAVNYTAWHPSGKYIAIADRNGNKVIVYSFDGTNLTLLTSTTAFGSAVYGVDWSPDGKYLAAAVGDGTVVVYSFNGVLLSSVATKLFGAAAWAVKWNGDGKMLAIVGARSVLRTFLFNGIVLTPSVDYVLSPTPTAVFDCAWQQGGLYIGVVGKNASNFYYYIVSVGSVAPTVQALTNSLVYGNSALGSSANLTVNGLPTTVRGQIFTENNGIDASIINLNSDTTIASNSVLHISGDTIIEGGSHTLTVGDYGQIFIDNAVTLTLQNMTFSSGAKTIMFPPLCCAGSQSKLVLDNMTFLPGADIPFYQGQMFVYDAVHFTGTSAFVYSSPQSTFIKSGGSLYFDTSTTFSFTPATASKDQIVMSDATSQLVLNGCKLKITDTGMRLTKGTLTYQGSVTVDTKNGFYFSSLTTTTMVNYGASDSYVRAIVWSLDRKYLIIGGQTPSRGAGGFANTDELRVYKFNGTTLAPVTSRDYGDSIKTVALSPSGNYLAIGGMTPTSGGTTGFTNTDELRIYQFNGTSLTPITSQDYGLMVVTAAWSPDGNYLAIGGYSPASTGGFTNTDELRLYKFNGTSLTPITSQDYGNGVLAISWSPDGNYLAIGGYTPQSTGGFSNNDEIRVYQFNGTTLAPVTSQDYGTSGSSVDTLAWSPDGNYLAIGGTLPTSGAGGFTNTDELRIYQFNGTTLTPVTSRDYGDEILTVMWSPDGKYLAIGGMAPTSGGTTGFANTDGLRIYQFDGTALNPVTSKNYGNFVYSIAWSPNGQHIAIGGNQPLPALNNSEVQIYAPVLGANLNPQAQSNSLVYGNPALGSGGNLAISGVPTTVRGNVLNQNV